MGKSIVISGCYQNNLHIENMNIPLHSLVVFSGPSGSGKSSLAIDSILQEGQRRCFDALQSVLPIQHQSIPRPNVESISNLPPTFGLKQDIGIQFRAHDTILDIVGLSSLLEQLFLQYAVCHCPVDGEILHTYTPRKVCSIVLENYPEHSCYILVKIEFTTTTYKETIQELHKEGYTRIRYNATQYLIEDAPPTPPTELYLVLDRIKIRPNNVERCFEAVQKAFASVQRQCIVELEDPIHKTTIERQFSSVSYSPTTKTFYPSLQRQHLHTNHPLGSCRTCVGIGMISNSPCTDCNQTGLGVAGQYKIDGVSFKDILSWQFTELYSWVLQLQTNPNYSPNLLQEIRQKLEYCLVLDLHTPLGQKMNSVSTGEKSRLRLIGVISTQLGESLYILDEPSLGLHDSQVQTVIHLLQKRKQEGQSFIVVDHHPLFIEKADTVFYFGPKSGKLGGRLVEKIDSVSTIEKKDIDHKTFKQTIPYTVANIPIYQGALHILTGLSGAGKTQTLRKMHAEFSQKKDLELLHFDTITANVHKRSSVVTITNLWTEIRNLFASTKSAKLHRLQAKDFSFNKEGGRCPTCLGLGSIPFAVPPLPPTEIVCPECQGKRFHHRTLLATYQNHNIADILALSVGEALGLFSAQPKLYTMVKSLHMVGLEYITLGQVTPSLSGGEYRRIQLAQVLEPCLRTQNYYSKNSILLLDDPTAALHPNDAISLQQCFIELRKSNVTIVMVSNNPHMHNIADYIYTI